MAISSWGNYPQKPQHEISLNWRSEALPTTRPLLPHGFGRSYGDVALNSKGAVVTTRRLNHFISFDTKRGILRCEAGVSLAEILQLIVPAGWFLHVTPGTKFISLGGAIANDVHGKNHHRAGSFGAYITQFELLRSTGHVICSPDENTDLFKATIGGLGLTGLITWAEISLKPLSSTLLNAQAIKTRTLSETISTIKESLSDYEYVIASLDSAAPKNRMGRSIVLRGNHLPKALPEDARESISYTPPKFTVPAIVPISPLHPATIKLFSKLYYYRQFASRKTYASHFEPFFYPQDAIGYWNRMYGPKGFLQYQCQIPYEHAEGNIMQLLSLVSKTGYASPISTLKPLGKPRTPAMLSFPREGFTLALDFPNTGEKLLELFDEMDTVVMKSGGALYPAKDARMSSDMFKKSYPNSQEFSAHIDPAFSSDFWRRVTNSVS